MILKCLKEYSQLFKFFYVKLYSQSLHLSAFSDSNSFMTVGADVHILYMFRYWVFRAWGRVGTTIGGNKLESCGGSGGVAKEKFMELYAEKTGNEWADKKNFTKYPNKFYPLDIDYGGVSNCLQMFIDC